MAKVVFERVRKVYGNGHVAVDGADFEAGDGELLVLVGPSGCGKSTLLRMITGLEDITSGTLSIDGRVVNDVAPKDRDIAMVFQNYALYPHMTVAENLAFGLKLRGLDRTEVEAKIRDAAGMLGLENMLARLPRELSGGQRQRVALGRALVREPKVFLLDEPLSNLDAKLRLTMRTEIARLHRRLGTTMIYVTHDQIEAMTLGQRIVVMKDGVIQQIDAPMALYDRPANVFVATFLGSPKMNLLWGPLVAQSGALRLRIADGLELALTPPPAMRAQLQKYLGQTLTVGLRPEHLHLSSDAASGKLPARVEAVEPVGNEAFINLGCGGCDLVVRVPPQRLPKPGDVVSLGYESQHMHYFAPDTGIRIEVGEMA